MLKLTRYLSKGDKFVAYDLKAKRKSLWGGVCTVVSTKENNHNTLVHVQAVDCNGQKRVFPAGRKWGFLKRT